MTVFLLIQASPGREETVKGRLENCPEVSEVCVVIGGYNVFAKLTLKREEVVAFLKKNVIGKDVLETRTLYSIGVGGDGNGKE